MMQPPSFTSEVRERFSDLAADFDAVEETIIEYEARFEDRFTASRRAPLAEWRLGTPPEVSG